MVAEARTFVSVGTMAGGCTRGGDNVWDTEADV